MARSTSSSTQSKGKSGHKAASPAAKSAQKKGSSQSAQASKVVYSADRHLLDARARRDIWGVACIVVAAILFIITAMPASGIVTSWLSETLHLGLGVGAYILPFALLLVGVSLFVKREGRHMPARVAAGLLLMFVSILVAFSLNTPGISQGVLEPLFLDKNLASQGGYVGAAFAWALMLLFGKTVSIIIVVGLIAIALIVIGFSVSAFVERMRAHASASRSASRVVDHRSFEVNIPEMGTRTRKLSKRDQFEEDTVAIDEPASDQAPTKPVRKTKDKRVEQDATITRNLVSKEAMKAARRAPEKKKAPKASSVVPAPAPSEGFELPRMELLKSSGSEGRPRESEETLRETAMLLQETLSDFGVNAQVVGWVSGPTVTLFKVDLPSGVRVNKVTNLQDDIALALAATGVRIFAPIPGTNYVGIEVPNVKPQTVCLGDVLPSASPGPLQIVVGEDVEGNYIIDDLAKMPHLLVAGTTGSGKSVAINGMIMSILMRATPAEVRFIMIDPKRVEFTPYNGIPHLYVPVVTECREAAAALAWAVAEMERRLKVFAKVGARNIGQYNAKAQAGMQIGEEQAVEMPYIVIVIDELADLMMNVGKEVEFSISRLAQLARAAGIHMIIATQRPSTNVVTGLIKANITCRIALSVASGIDSRVILDQTGAENLIGHGDMLYGKPEFSKPIRLQGCFTSPAEIDEVVAHLKEQGEPEYHQEILQANIITIGQSSPDGSGGSGAANDPLLWEAAEIVVSSKLGSTSNIQRRLSVGYSRAGRIMDMLEEKGIVGPPNGSKPREVLVDPLELESLKAFEMND